MFEDKEEILKREKSDPNEGDRPWPLGMWIFVLSMTAVSFGYLLVFTGDGTIGSGDFRSEEMPFSATGQTTTGNESNDPAPVDPQADFLALGGQTYQSICAACHQSSGTGISGAFPPLDGSRWVTGTAEVPVKIVLHGLSGPIDVKGMTYNGVMPGFGQQLSDEEVAAVVSYVRNSWSNTAELIDASDVAQIRQTIGDRGPWTADELSPE